MRLTQAEWQIMKVLWKKHPATARQIMTRLPKGVSWAYTTIKTMLSRLVEKNAVSEQKQGNTSLYEPLVSQNKARRTALRSLIDRAFDGGVEPMMHFLVNDRELSAKERRLLMEMLREEDEKRGES